MHHGSQSDQEKLELAEADAEVIKRHDEAEKLSLSSSWTPASGGSAWSLKTVTRSAAPLCSTPPGFSILTSARRNGREEKDSSGERRREQKRGVAEGASECFCWVVE